MHMLYACIRILKVRVHIQLVCACILMPKNANLGFLITCLGLVEFSFHV